METKIAVVETKMNNTILNLERQINDHRSMRATFSAVTIGLVALLFGILLAYFSGLYWTMDKTVAFVQQQSEMATKQADLAGQQAETTMEMKEIKIQLMKINDSMDAILQDHKRALHQR